MPANKIRNTILASGERVALTDSRVKLHFLNFSQYHSESLCMAARWLGLHPGEVLPIDTSQLDLGLQFTSGRECLPLPLCIGQLVELHRRRRPGDILGFYMLRGGAPCVSEWFYGYFERFLAEHHLEDVFLLSPARENDYLGFDPAILLKHLSPAVLIADILVEMESVLRVVGPPGTLEQLLRSGSNSPPWRTHSTNSTRSCPFSSTA